VQIVGRGLRLSPGKVDCKVLDYGEVIKNLGSVFDPLVEKDKRKKATENDTQSVLFSSNQKLCKNCFSLMPIGSKVCLDCGTTHEFDYEKNLKEKAAARDIANLPKEVVINRVMLYQHTSRNTLNKCVKINYQGNLMTYSQYFTSHPYSWGKAKDVLKELTGWDFDSFDECYDNLNDIVVEKTPESISIKRDGKFDRITKITFKDKIIRG
jgi:DNA repair protein RadD